MTILMLNTININVDLIQAQMTDGVAAPNNTRDGPSFHGETVGGGCACAFIFQHSCELWNW